MKLCRHKAFFFFFKPQKESFSGENTPNFLLHMSLPPDPRQGRCPLDPPGAYCSPWIPTEFSDNFTILHSPLCNQKKKTYFQNFTVDEEKMWKIGLQASQLVLNGKSKVGPQTGHHLLVICWSQGQFSLLGELSCSLQFLPRAKELGQQVGLLANRSSSAGASLQGVLHCLDCPSHRETRVRRLASFW